MNRLVFYESFPTAIQAIEAGKKIKGWRRSKKVELVQTKNPKWEDSAADWFSPVESSSMDSSQVHSE